VCVGNEFPGLGSIEEMSGDASIAKINASGADFLLVALGASKGQAWIVHNRARISVPVISHLGAVLNFVAGTVTRAPKWMQNCGLEWLWRIKEEPLLWRRYVHDGRTLLSLFVTRILPHAIFIRYHWPTADQMATARLEVAEEEHCCVVRLWGPWTHANLASLRDSFSAAVRVRKNVRVEMGGVTFISSSIVGLLILLNAHQKQHRRQLKMTSVPKPVRLIFKYSCAEYLFSHTERRNLPHQVRILNARFDPLTLLQTVDSVFDLLRAGQRGWLCTVNVSILMMMRTNWCLQNFVDQAALTVADGQPLIWCASWFGRFLPERVAGIELIDALCARAAREGKRVYLLGSTEAIIDTAAQRLRERHTNLHVEWAHGYFSQDQASARADRIRASGADILFVGIGVPRQENFIDEQWDRLGVGMAIGVGGSFDVVGGRRSRAPVWMQKSGLEWMYRAIQEPRRLFPRYLITNSKMVWLVLRELLKANRAN
jgi:N-acetylglucosaminyldiphosphoundecaprenol N-acetyl-beta-D-mannosaminyltransferase